ncbi:transporter substrate-binding domain-containing protein [Caballeronia grimmiae]|uniref:transporter substrate-binding domain-containing protein n=1 Tax=Caballeronia grimmiae TaxID=1071679 RepID=UPI0038B8C545
MLAGLLPRPAHAGEPAPVGPLARIKQAGTINMGYLSNAQPFAYRDNARVVTGYTVGLCKEIAKQIKRELGRDALKVNWVAVTSDDRGSAMQQHRIDLLCGDADTLAGRQTMSYSIPVIRAASALFCVQTRPPD